jgi:hypothetical protein
LRPMSDRNDRAIPSALLFVLAAFVAACSEQRPEDAADRTHDSTSLAPAPPSSPLVQSGQDSAVARIRAHFALIERERPGYQCRTVMLRGFSAEGGELEACYAGNQLRRLSAVYLAESGRGREQYYFWNDSLEFLFRRTEHYSEPMSGDVVRAEEDRFYWSSGILIRRLNPSPGSEAPSPTAAAAEERDARETARKLAACAARAGDSPCVA